MEKHLTGFCWQSLNEENKTLMTYTKKKRMNQNCDFSEPSLFAFPSFCLSLDGTLIHQRIFHTYGHLSVVMWSRRYEKTFASEWSLKNIRASAIPVQRSYKPSYETEMSIDVIMSCTMILVEFELWYLVALLRPKQGNLRDLDSGFHSLDFGSKVLDFGSKILHFGFQRPEFHIPQGNVFRIPRTNHFLDYGTRIIFHRANCCE